jgi:uncharacterized protein (TIGR03067 family)
MVISYLHIATCLLILAEPAKETNKDVQGLIGKWNCKSIRTHGIDLVGQDFEDTKFDITLKKAEMIVKSNDASQTWSYRVDSAANPKSIDISYEEEGKPVTLKGIYRVDNGELTLCWDVPGRERPKEFKSEPKSTVQVIVFRRAGRD